MPFYTVIAVNVSGDIGATGISRFHVKRLDGTAPIAADCNSAGAALHAMYVSASAYMPTQTQWSFQSQCGIFDEATAELQGYVNMTSVPAIVPGASSGSYPAGNGLRIDWLTATVRNRRLMRAATYMVPLASVAYTATGQVNGTVAAAFGGYAQTMLNALATASLELVAYHRPAKGTFVGGTSGPVTAFRVPVQPASLRSRRS